MVTSLAALAAAKVSTAWSPLSTRKKLAKSTPPSAKPIGGMMTSLTSELTMPVKEAPMITPTARSTTVPRTANFLNSSIRAMEPSIVAKKGKRGVRLITARRLNKPPRHRQIGDPHRQPRQGAEVIGGKIAPLAITPHHGLHDLKRPAQCHHPCENPDQRAS